MPDIVISANQGSTPIKVQLSPINKTVNVAPNTTYDVSTSTEQQNINVEIPQSVSSIIQVGDPVYLDDLVDVSVLNPSLDYVLSYDGSRWVASDPNVLVNQELNDLLDVSISNPVEGEYFVYRNGVWVAETPGVPVDNWSSFGETNPVYSYINGLLSRVDYSSGNYKIFIYNENSTLVTLDYVRSNVIYRKTFTYDIDEILVAVVYSVH